MVYGPYVDYGGVYLRFGTAVSYLTQRLRAVVMCFLAVAAVYGYIGQPMKALYAPSVFIYSRIYSL